MTSIIAILLSALSLVGLGLHFNAFSGDEPMVGTDPRVQVVSQGSLGTSTSPVAGDMVMSWAAGSYGPTAVYAGTGITLATSTYRRLTISTDSTVATFAYPFPLAATSTVVTFSNGASIAKLTNLTGNGFVKTSGGDGTLSVDTNTYATFAFPWTFSNPNGQAGNSTSTLLRFLGGATSTDFSANTAAFGQTATATISSAGVLSLPSALTVSSGGTGATTLTGCLTGNGTGAITGLGTCAVFAYPFSITANWGQTFNSTTTGMYFSGTTYPSLFSAHASSTDLSSTIFSVGGTATSSFGADGVFQLVSGSNPTLDAVGEMALDTTENELLFATSTNAGAPAVIKPYEWKGFANSSSTRGTGTSTKPWFIAPPVAAGYMDMMTCHATSTTVTKAFISVQLKDESYNAMNSLVASSTEGNVRLNTNNAFTAGEVFYADVGTSTNVAAPLDVSCWVKIIYTRN